MPAPRRLKLSLILLILAASAVALFAWTRVWIHARVATGATGAPEQLLPVDGSSAAPALTALALAGLALAGALTIAGPAIRVVLGVLQVLLGGCVVWAALTVLTDPAAASASSVTAATGVAGEASVLGGIASATPTGWPFVAVGAGIVMVLAGIAVLVTARSWPLAASRYQAVRFQPAAADTPGDTNARAVDSWDDLTRGTDPTT